jgi:cytochrome b561
MSTLQVSRYHPAVVALHWALAALIIADLTIGTLVLRHIPNDSAMKLEALRAHMSGGLLILTLMLARLGVRATAAAPAEAPTGSSLLDRVAWLSHRMLYVAVFGMAGSGLIMALQAHVPDVVFFGRGKLPASFWEFSLRGVHYFFARLLMALIALHIAGALYHTFIRRDHLLRRMWFGSRRVGDAASAGAATSATYGSATFWRYAPWLTRLILTAPTLLFILIGWSYLGQPLQTTAESGTLLGSPAAVTDTRAMGAIFLALAALTLFALVSERRLLAGLFLVAIIDGFATAARVLGIVVDGAPPETMFKLVAELVLLTLCAIGILIEVRRRRHIDRPLFMGDAATSFGG